MGKQNQFLRLSLLPQDQEIALGLLIGLGLDTLVEKTEKKGSDQRLIYEVSLDSKQNKKMAAKEIIRAISDKEKHLAQKIFLSKKLIRLKQDDWKTEYEKFLKPFELPIPKKTSSEKYPYEPLLIDPHPKTTKKLSKNSYHQHLHLRAQTAFGTGTHPSTQLAALLLQEILWERPKIRILDMGTGSGLLAMVAHRRGAQDIWALDNDPEALKVAQRNFRENLCSNIKVTGQLKANTKPFDLIVANILAPTLIDLKPFFKQYLNKKCLDPKGALILSGLTYGDTQEIREAYQDWKFLKRLNQKGWSACLFQYPVQ